jgi:hypothetical protein
MSSFEVSSQAIVQELLADTRFQLQKKGGYLYGGPCPGCGKKELFISTEKPWVLKCNRLNKCGWEEQTRDLLPDLFTNLTERFPPTDAEPNRTADAYLGMNRGFDLSRIRGWYEQGTYQYPNSNDFTPTVRFYLDADRKVFWQRLLKPRPNSGGKARFHGEYRGMVWMPPAMELEQGDRVFIVEGIFHAIALYHCGYKAVAALSCANFPEAFITAHKGKKIRWVLALDGDKAGGDYTKRHAAKLNALNERFDVCRLQGKQDWDDLYRAGKITEKLINDGMYYGRLFMAKSANEKAYHYYVRHESKFFIIDYDYQLYRVEAGQKLSEALEMAVVTRRNKEEQEASIAAGGLQPVPAAETAANGPKAKEQESMADLRRAILESPQGWDMFLQHADLDCISNVLPECLYHEADDLVETQQYYVFRITAPNGTSQILPLEGSHLLSALTFSSALINKTAGSDFSGTNGDFMYLRKRWLATAQKKSIRRTQYMGYVRSLDAYVFDQCAYYKGKEIALNEEGFYRIGQNGVRPHLKGVHINTSGEFSPHWLEDYMRVFHWQGLALLAFWVGTLFADQIRQAQKSYPFFEFTGEPGAGKTTALEFLWKCCGRDREEGFDLLKSSQAGRRRMMSQLSNLPVVLIESDRDAGSKDGRQRQFNFDEFKAYYNGRSTGTVGIRNRGNEVDEHMFQGGLVISQNAEVDGSDALLERIVHCHVDKSHHGNGTRELARWFERQSAATVGGMLRKALQAEHRILEVYFAAFDRFEAKFIPHLKHERIMKNHAQVAAAGEALSVLFPQMTRQRIDALGEYLLERAKLRQSRLEGDSPLVADFWETFHYLNEEADTRQHGRLNHSAQEGIIAISLKEYESVCKHHGLSMPDMRILSAQLKNSKRHPFIDSNASVWSRWTKTNKKCWRFKA